MPAGDKIRNWVPASSRQALLLTVILFGSVASYWIINSLLFGFVQVTGSSMLPTLAEGETHLLHRWRVLTDDPARGNIVAIRDPLDNHYSVKRIIGLPRERIEIKEGRVFIDEVVFEEIYLAPEVKTQPYMGKDFKTGHNQYFLLGDNRKDSVDSRFYGPVTGDRILGMIYP